MLCVVQDAFSSLEGVLSHVITRLSTSLLYEKEDTDLLAVRHNIVYTNYPRQSRLLLQCLRIKLLWA